MLIVVSESGIYGYFEITYTPNDNKNLGTAIQSPFHQRIHLYRGIPCAL